MTRLWEGELHLDQGIHHSEETKRSYLPTSRQLQPLPGCLASVYRPSYSLAFTLSLSALVPLGGGVGVLAMLETAHLENAGHRTTLGNAHYPNPIHHQCSSWLSG